jgi:hypothetical protein
MPLKDFSLIAPKIEPGELLQAIESVIPTEAIDRAIAATNSQEQRHRRLPTHLVVALVIAMHVWSDYSLVDVLKNLMDGLSRRWIRLTQRWRVPNKSSITEARQRVGPQVMSQLFTSVVRPLATPATPGAFLGGLRLMSVDGTVLDVPDTKSNAKVFGYPGSRAGTRAAFPKARLVVLVEAGTHLLADALLSPYRIGERVRALRLLRSVGEGMLLMWDRGLHSFRMVHTTLQQKAHFLGRVPANVKFEGVEPLADGSYLSWIVPNRKSKKKGAKPRSVPTIRVKSSRKSMAGC